MVVLGAGLLAAIAFFLVVPPIPQDLAYHEFADTRDYLGIPNFWNVASNLLFVVVGSWGTLFILRQGRAGCVAGLELAYIVFFAGIFLTGLGSGYYHLGPANDPLVWDRLPMTIAFAGLFSIIVGEFLSPRAGRMVLIPLLVLGALSVEYWAFTETRGVGDLRPYAVFQFVPMLLIPFIMILHQPIFDDVGYFWMMLLFYVLSKVSEFLDAAIFDAVGFISGHSLKHLFAGLAAATLLYALARRCAPARAANDD